MDWIQSGPDSSAVNTGDSGSDADDDEVTQALQQLKKAYKRVKREPNNAQALQEYKLARAAADKNLHRVALGNSRQSSVGVGRVNDLLGTLTNAFNEPFVDVDKLLPLFNEHIAMCFAYPNMYYRYTTIVQSSGYGKSRLIQEYAKQAYTIQICLRPRNWTGFPPRWDAVASYLEPVLEAGLMKKRFFTLFAVCVDALCVYLGQKGHTASYEGFNSFYRGHIETLLRNKEGLANIKLQCAPRVQRLLICFDEPVVWFQSGDIKPFLAFRHATDELYDANVLCVLTDTTKKIASFPPSTAGPCNPSTRVIIQQMHLMPSFYFLWSFDLPAATEIDKLWPELPPREKKLFRLFCLGRPLWRSLLPLAGRNPLKLVKFAKAKLACGDTDHDSPQFHLALLSCRYSLNLVPQSQLCDTLLAEHMATCLWLSPARESVLVSYVSEPVLAEAATQLLFHQKLQPALNVLASALLNGVVESGYPRGELVARILLLPFVKQMSPGYHSEPITVRMYFLWLLGQDNYNTYVNASFPEILLDGFVTATHVVPITYEISSPNELKGLYRRRSAAICKRNQTGDDLLIPIKFKVGNNSVYSAIKIQCKNWQSEVHFNRLTSLGMEHLSAATKQQRWRKTFAKWSKDTPVPLYVNLYLQLGAKHAAIFDPYAEIAKLPGLFAQEKEALQQQALALNAQEQEPEWLVKKMKQLEAKQKQLEALPSRAGENQFSLMLIGLSASLYPSASTIIGELERLLTAWPDALALLNSQESKSCYAYFAKNDHLQHVQSALSKSLGMPPALPASIFSSPDILMVQNGSSRSSSAHPQPAQVQPQSKRQRLEDGLGTV